MLRPLSLLVACALLGSPVLSHALQAAEKKSGKLDGTKVSVMGKVSTVKTDVDNYTSIKLTMSDGKVYNVTLDDKGKDLAKQYEGISVVANGMETTKDKELWLTVTSTGEKKGKKK